MLIVLDGANAGASAKGLEITAGNSTVRGLVISGFDGAIPAAGIHIPAGGGNFIRGNYIGVAADGTTALGNTGASGRGVTVIGASNNNQIGGAAAGEGNIIAFNALEGVSVNSSAGTRIEGNSIHSNAGLGIDLGTDGVTANDAGDADTGANNLQNFPVVNSAATAAGSTTVTGALDSTANSTFRVEFFTTPACDGTNGEGCTRIGSQIVTTDGAGAAGEPADFASTTGTVTFSDGDAAPKSLSVAINDDARDEPDESFTLSLSVTSGAATAGSPAQAAVTITDDDPPPAISGRVTNAADNQPLAGVTVTLSGAQSATTQTDANGNYSFTGLPAGETYPVTAERTSFTFMPPVHTFERTAGSANVADFVGSGAFTISGRVG